MCIANASRRHVQWSIRFSAGLETPDGPVVGTPSQSFSPCLIRFRNCLRAATSWKGPMWGPELETHVGENSFGDTLLRTLFLTSWPEWRRGNVGAIRQ